MFDENASNFSKDCPEHGVKKTHPCPSYLALLDYWRTVQTDLRVVRVGTVKCAEPIGEDDKVLAVMTNRRNQSSQAVLELRLRLHQILRISYGDIVPFRHTPLASLCARGWLVARVE